MPEHIRAFIVVIVLSGLGLFIARKVMLPGVVEKSTLNLWSMAWLLITTAAFLSHSFWIYCIFAALILVFLSRSNASGGAGHLYALLLLSVPSSSATVQAGGLFNYLLQMNHSRLLSLVLLLPASFQRVVRIRQEAVAVPGGARVRQQRSVLLPHGLLLLFGVSAFASYFRDTTLTDAFRQALYLYLEMFLPYFAVTRMAANAKDLQRILAAYVIACIILSLVAVFELTRSWLLYPALVNALGTDWGLGGYLGRDSLLRASATTGHPIVLGFVMTVAIAFLLAMKSGFRTGQFVAAALLLVGGLIASLSRGPWLGCVVLFLIFAILSSKPAKSLLQVLAAGSIALVLTFALPGGERVRNLLPFIGNIEVENVSYRQRLFENSMIVIWRHPWFGSADYLEAPEMQELTQGQGIIDIVNSFLEIALRQGFVGVLLFLAFWLSVLLNVQRTRMSLPREESGTRDTGRALMAAIVATLFMITTTSSISVIPMIYWMLAGLCMGYCRTVSMDRSPATASH